MNFCRHPGHAPKINRLARRIFGHGFPRRTFYFSCDWGMALFPKPNASQARLIIRSWRTIHTLLHIGPAHVLRFLKQREQNSSVLPFSLTSRIAKRAFSLRKGFQSYSESIILDIWEITFEIYPAPYPFADNIRFSVTLGIFN